MGMVGRVSCGKLNPSFARTVRATRRMAGLLHNGCGDWTGEGVWFA